MQNKKASLPYVIRKGMEDHAKKIGEMQDGEAKEFQKMMLAEGFRTAADEYEMPEGGAVSRTIKNLLAPFDYVGGIARTAVGESLLLPKNIAEGMTPEKARQAKDRISSAVLPFGELAPPTSLYLEKLGMGEGGRLSNAEWLPDMIQPNRDSWADITGRGALGLLGDVLLTPGAAVSQGGKELAKRSLPLAAPGKTAAQYTEELAQLIKPKDTLEKAKEFSKSVGRFFMNPQGETGKALYDFGLREANDAAASPLRKGHTRPFSDALLENGSTSFRAKGIRQDVQNILEDTTKQANLVKRPPAAKLAEQLSLYDGPFQGQTMGMPTTSRDEIFNPVLNSQQVLDALETTGQTGPTQAALARLRQMMQDTAEYVPPGNENSQLRRFVDDRAMAENLSARVPERSPLQSGPELNFGVDPATGKELVPEALPAGQELFKKPPGDVKTLYKIPAQQEGVKPGYWNPTETGLPRLKRELVSPEVPAKRVQDYRADGTPFFRDIPAKPAVYKDVPYLEPYTGQEWVPSQPIMGEPRIGQTRFPQEPAPYTKPANILEHGSPSLDPTASDRLASSMQGVADRMGTYSQDTMFWPPTQQNVADVDANRMLGWMANEVAKRARFAAQKNLDEFSPGKGGDLWRIYKDKAALRTGAPFMEREFTETGKRGASTGLRMGMRAGQWSGGIMNALDGTGDASARALGQLLMSPGQRYLGGPAMRSGMINEIYNQEYNDPKRNPWGAVKKYGEGK